MCVYHLSVDLVVNSRSKASTPGVGVKPSPTGNISSSRVARGRLDRRFYLDASPVHAPANGIGPQPTNTNGSAMTPNSPRALAGGGTSSAAAPGVRSTPMKAMLDTPSSVSSDDCYAQRQTPGEDAALTGIVRTVTATLTSSPAKPIIDVTRIPAPTNEMGVFALAVDSLGRAHRGLDPFSLVTYVTWRGPRWSSCRRNKWRCH